MTFCVSPYAYTRKRNENNKYEHMSVQEFIQRTTQAERRDQNHMTGAVNLQKLIQASTDIAHPGEGRTLSRWQTLAQVAATDLNLVKWFESHLDALSILHELGYTAEHDAIYAVWAAEGGPQPLRVQDHHCYGMKAWCSGAGIVEKALMTYRDEQQQSQLILVDLRDANIQIDHSVWQAVGMAQTATANISFDHVAVEKIAGPNAYLDRPGFWHGAAGVAACWYGASSRLAQQLFNQLQNKPHPFKAMYLGEISTALHINRQYFYEIAQRIDQSPHQTHEYNIRMLRQFTEQTARLVMEKVGLALGAAPYCQDGHFARLIADLSVFIRQTHGAFDLAQIGELTIEQEIEQWTL